MQPLELLYGLGALVLLAALVWGIVQYKTRNKANDPLTEAATREEYDHPETYEQKQDEFKEQVRPS
ncbi:hypothetical protein [Phenylobacterium sp.]|uniref:hypothetical protein n=1 Tax=Phenylobacterium sp. TaxID=1871053 RepID=UPI002ED9102B